MLPGSTTTHRSLLLAGAVAMALLSAPTAASAANHVVAMANMSYGRLPSDIKVGDTITWVNQDSVPHTVTARDKSFDLRLAPGQKGTMTASKPGSFPFYCIYHATMRGVLKVAAK
ncbi:MAG TPA: cupredoxin domain-containing protein [Sphingomonas sp.]|nr:cupredoxin domain-containing protein [Sphingomonas sp.]